MQHEKRQSGGWKKKKKICFDSDSSLLQSQDAPPSASILYHHQPNEYSNLHDPECTPFNRIKPLFPNCFLRACLFLSIFSVFITRLEPQSYLSLPFLLQPPNLITLPNATAHRFSPSNNTDSLSVEASSSLTQIIVIAAFSLFLCHLDTTVYDFSQLLECIEMMNTYITSC